MTTEQLHKAFLLIGLLWILFLMTAVGVLLFFIGKYLKVI
jgi:hypothetical protein